MAAEGASTLMLIKDLPEDSFEAQTVVDTKSDTLAKEFTPGKFFEIHAFSLSTSGAEKDATARDRREATRGNDSLRRVLDAGARRETRREADSARDDFLQNGQVSRFEFGFEKVEVKRDFDLASIQIFNACSERLSFPGGIIVQRKLAGGLGMRTFFRLELGPLLITEVNWQDDDVMEEEFSLITTKMKWTYLVQERSGSMRDEREYGRGEWSHIAAKR